MERTYSEVLAAFVGSVRYENLPLEVRRMAKNCFLDWIGCALASRNELAVKSMAAVARLSKGIEQSTVIPYAERNSALLSALVNGAASHALETDDVHRDSVLHAGTVVMPAVFAVAEREGASGKALIEAIVVGYEVMIRVGEGVGRSHYWFWHNTSTCGTFGSTAGVGKIIGLTAEQYVHALGNAGSQSSGLWQFLENGANTKLLHTGKAAMNGIIAADLAKRNFTGGRKIFEGEKGFYRATSKDFDLAKLNQGLDDKLMDYKILSNSFKRYPSCRHTHPMIDATLELVFKNNLQWQSIQKVEVHTYSGAINLCSGVELENAYVAKWHIPFSVATAIKYKGVGRESYTDLRIHEKDLLDLSSKVSLHLAPDLDALYPAQWPARVQIYVKGGDHYQTTVYYPKGDPENPLSMKELVEKFRNNTAPILSSECTESLIKEINCLEDQRDLSTFLKDMILVVGSSG